MKKVITVVVLMLAATLGMAQSAPTTSREYYQEIKDAGGIPKWAVNVCFEEHLVVSGQDIGDDSMFTLMGTSTGNWVTMQEYGKGIDGGHK